MKNWWIRLLIIHAYSIAEVGWLIHIKP
jgi:hypothetical protein